MRMLVVFGERFLSLPVTTSLRARGSTRRQRTRRPSRFPTLVFELLTSVTSSRSGTSVSRESSRATLSCVNVVPFIVNVEGTGVVVCGRRRGAAAASAGIVGDRRLQRERTEPDVVRQHQRDLAQEPVPGDPSLERGRECRVAERLLGHERRWTRSRPAPASGRAKARCALHRAPCASSLHRRSRGRSLRRGRRRGSTAAATPVMSGAAGRLRSCFASSRGRRLTARISLRSRARSRPRASRSAARRRQAPDPRRARAATDRRRGR